jgi:hypothetical protein
MSLQRVPSMKNATSKIRNGMDAHTVEFWINVNSIVVEQQNKRMLLLQMPVLQEHVRRVLVAAVGQC